MPQRAEVWHRLATDMKPLHLAGLTRVIGLDELPSVFDGFIQARIKGRIVVNIAG
jgi:alcohol dehydrogenase